MPAYGFAQGNLGQPGLSVQWFPRAYTATITPASVAANVSAEQTFTVTGVTTKDQVSVSAPSITAGLVIGGARVSAANTVAITFGNLTAGSLTPTAGEYFFKATKAKD
jgi:hypothetical protein